MEVAAAVVGKEDVDRFAAGVGGVLCGFNGVVDGVDDVGMGSEEGVGFHLFESKRNGFLTEGTADLFERIELRSRCFLDEVDVGEAALVMRQLTGLDWSEG